MIRKLLNVSSEITSKNNTLERSVPLKGLEPTQDFLQKTSLSQHFLTDLSFPLKPALKLRLKREFILSFAFQFKLVAT